MINSSWRNYPDDWTFQNYYGENYSSLLPIVREKLNLSIEDRKEFILEEKWITYPNAKEILDKLSKKLSQFKMNGYRNIWIIKPENLSRGRGIMIMNNLSEILSQYTQSSSLIVQKYIK